MAYPPSHIWSSEEATPWNPPRGRAFSLGVAAALGGGAFYGATRGSPNSARLIDNIQRVARHASFTSPWSFANTFGVASWMSPFVSSEMHGAKNLMAQQFTGPGGSVVTRDVVGVHWGKEFLGTGETQDLLRRRFGDATFDRLGIGRDFTDRGFELFFERDARSVARGSLFTRRGPKDPWQLVSDAAQLFERTPVSAQDLSMGAHAGLRQPGVTPAAQAVLQAEGYFTEKTAASAKRLFTDISTGATAQYDVIPSIGGPVRNLSDIGARTTYFRSLYAFGAERLKRLIATTADQIPVLGHAAKAFEHHLGIPLSVRTGTGTEMFFRFGGKAAAVGGAVMAVKQLDWMRREGGLPGHIAISGAFAAGAAALTKKFTKRQPLAMGVGVASFFGQLILPGWDRGSGQGLADTWGASQVGLAAVGKVTGLNIYRRTLEGFAPGITSWQMGAAAGIALATAAHTPLPAMLIKRYGKEALNAERIFGGRVGLQASALDGPRITPPSIRDTYWNSVRNIAVNEGFLSEERVNTIMGRKSPLTIRRQELLGSLMSSARKRGEAGSLMDRFKLEWASATAERKNFLENNPLNESLKQSINRINKHYDRAGSPSIVARASKQAEIMSSRIYHAFFGANLSKDLVGKEYLTKMFDETGLKPRMGRIGVLFGAGFAAHKLLTAGGIGSLEDPSDLRDIYRGDKFVEVRSGRLWEGGGTPIEGKDVKYMRPHRFALWRSRASERARWGADEDDISPVKKFFLKNFTYELERRTYWDRPHVITGTAFEDLPMIGPALGATIGRLIKPPKLMHVPDWVREGPGKQLQFAHSPEYRGPNYELGGLSPGRPMSPYTAGFAAGELNYRFREMEGMTGWLSNVITKKLTGSETFFAQRPVLGTAGSITDPREAFWGLDIGGAFFTSELVRRFLPKVRPEVQEYNPILNTMPSWLPDRFKTGDPYRSIDDGDVRLPGPGYQAIHPELAGVNPENYPIAYRYAILADVANWSPEFRSIRSKVYQARAAGLSNDRENDFIDLVDTRLNKKLIGEGFLPTHKNAIEVPLISRATQSAWNVGQRSLRAIVEPAEYMMPFGFRPVSKLLSKRDPIEAYERERLYGTNMAFWDKPVRDWLRPSAYQAANMMGYRGVPGHVQEMREADEYFDKLEFMKWMSIAQSATGPEKRRALYKAQQTRAGVNPQGDALAIYAALPDQEKQFYDAFTLAKGEDRQRIMEMVPADQAELYRTVWARLDRGDPGLHPGSSTQINEAYLSGRFNELQGYFYDKPLPSEDWIGWHEDADMRDIKIKYADELGRDVHEYGGWQRDVRMNARKPYLEGSTEFLYQDHALHRDAIGEMMYNMPRPEHISGSSNLSVHSMRGGQTEAQMYYNDSRESDILSMISRAL